MVNPDVAKLKMDLQESDNNQMSDANMVESHNNNNGDVGGGVVVDDLRTGGHLGVEPPDGIDFDTHEAAYTFYQDYAKSMGFTTSIKNSRRSKKTKDFIDAKFACSRYGSTPESESGSSSGRRSSVKKTDCKASMHVKRKSDGRWIIHEFIKEHNHELLPALAYHFRIQRNIKLAEKNNIDILHAVSERTRKMYVEMSRQSGGYNKNNKGLLLLQTSQVDKGRRCLALEEGDSQLLLEYFKRIKKENPRFFYAIDLNEEQRLRNLFWADAKSRDDYMSFNDVVSFDTTYVKFNDKLPLALFIGVNHHSQPMLLGCGLVADESKETFAWLIKTWLRAMGGRAPKVILTDQDKLLMAAVSELLPNTRHCFALWHVLEKLPEYFSHVMKRHDNFLRKFNKCIFRSWTSDQFDMRWWKMVSQFGLENDEWLLWLHEHRQKWVPTFMSEVFLAGMSTSQRAESVNSFFDKYVHKKITLKEFLRQYGVMQQNRYEANLALGIHGDESPSVALKGKLIPSPIPEEIKRLKAGLRENNVKARERVKIFNEASSVFNKFFPSVPTKKRSRPGGYSGERLVSGSGLGKMGIQGQTLAGGFELDPQKLDERPRTGVPNKRTRTSVMDVRSNSIVRQSAVVDRDKEIMRPANHNAVQGEDRTSAGIDGWEKSKMKKKRSCIKTDFHPNLASNKVVDGYQDLRQGTQRKPMCDSRTRLNGDSNMSRQAAANGTSGYGRSDNLAQQTSLAGHSPRPGLDPDHNSLYIEKRERSIGSDKERVNQRAVNKSNIHDEFNSSSLISNTKPNASVRGPRSGSGLPPKLSPRLHNTPSPSEWDISGCTNRSPQLSTPLTHRKRMTSNRSSSPPVTQWASQRPQKISRTARRTNLVPIVSNRDEAYSDSISDGGCSENGFGFHKRSPAASPQLRLKGENSFSTAALSESEESGPPEIKSKDKGKQSDEVDGKAAQNIPRASFPGLQSRKGSKPASGEETGDGVRRQGRTGRGFSSTRSLNPMGVEKLKNVGTAKQLRSARTILDKSESKLGRPPTRKLSGRKTCERQRATATNASPLDFQDDGHEELQAAVNSAVNFAQNFPNSFWKQMERYFCFISDDHINFMKHERELFSMGPPSPVLTSSDFDSRDLYPEELATSSVDSKASPLYHRLLSALISEDSLSINEDVHVDGFGAMHDLDEDSEFSVLNDNGFRNNDDYESEDGGSAILFNGLINSAYYHCNGKILDHSPIDFSDIPYDKLGIDEKIYLEAQSIGISLEPMPSISNVEDEGIVDEIKKLEEAICKEGSKKKKMVDRLLKSAIEMKEIQERELDQLGYDKLIEMAYEKSKASRRHHTVVGKNSTNKISKQAAAAFVKRTLERCRQFEETGKSCFSEPEIKDMFIARLSAAEDTLEDDNPSTSTPIGSQPSSSSLARIGQDLENNYANCSDAALEQTTRREDTSWSNRVKKRELLLDDVGIGAQLSSSTKGKRSERDRDGKGHAPSRSGTNKIGRPPSLSNDKGERKPKQKANQISSSVRTPEQPKAPLPEANGEHDNLEEDTEPIFDFSQLQIPDNLGGPEFDAQPGDISSWFNMDDDEDFDIMELGVPMDDLSGLNIKL